MTCVAFRGLRGGVGVTSIVAGVAHALHAMGGSVVVIDLSPGNLLQWHFGLGQDCAVGWSTSDAASWHENAYVVSDGLHVLPHGDGDANGSGEPLSIAVWNQRSRELLDRYDWVLFDAPSDLSADHFEQLGERRVCIMEADIASAIQLERFRLVTGCGLLINRYDPASQLQRDLRLTWSYRHPEHLLPMVAHRDEAVAQALAFKLPVGAYRADSLGAQDVKSLATWLLARRTVAL